MNFLNLDALSIQTVYISITVIMLLSYCLGYFLGKHFKRTDDKDAATSFAPMVSGLLGMLAFVLAFTFSIAADHHGSRRKNVLDEANAITSAYLRADLLAVKQRKAVKSLLKEYVDIRLKAAKGEDLNALITRSIEIHQLLLHQVSAAAFTAADFNTSLVIQAINRVIEMHENRLTAGIRNRIPSSVWMAIIIICILTMVTMGSQAGLAGKQRVLAILPLSMAFAALLVLVVDLNRPQKGLITVGQQAMVALQKKMKSLESPSIKTAH